MIRRLGGPGMHGVGGIPLMSLGGKGQKKGPAYDSIPNLVHLYEIARRGLTSYTGSLVRLRRDSDSLESDFGYVVGTNELNVAGIVTWLAGATGYIVAVYDQAGGNNLAQAAAGDQPLYVASMKNGHAGARFDGTNHYLQIAFTGALSQPFTYYAVAAMDITIVNDNQYHNLFDDDTGAARVALRQHQPSTPDTFAMYAGSSVTDGPTDTSWILWSLLYNGASSEIRRSGSLSSGNAGAANAAGLTVGSAFTGGAAMWKGDWVMLGIADPSNNDSFRASMEMILNEFWGVY